MDTVHECDRRTDGQTDRITITKTVQRIASHGKKGEVYFRPQCIAYSFVYSVSVVNVIDMYGFRSLIIGAMPGLF